LRQPLRWIRNLSAGIVIAFRLVRLIGRMAALLGGLMWARRRHRSTFRRSLLHSGLSEEEAESLTSRYHAKVSLRELLRFRASFRHSHGPRLS